MSIRTLHIGRTGLKAASYGIDVAGQNVTNASTEGYVRRRLVQQTRVPHRSGQGVFTGQGVTATAIHRDIDRFATERCFESLGEQSMANTANETLAVVEANFREGDTASIADRLDRFFDAATELTSEPSDHGLRLAMRDAGKDLSDAVNRGGEALIDAIRRVEDRIKDEINGVNEILNDMKVLNERISNSDAVTGPADLMDARDALVETLAEKVGVEVDYQGNGQVSLFVGGHAIVQEVQVRELDSSGLFGALSIKMSAGSGSVTVDEVIKGELGGLLRARDQMGVTLTSLDTFAEEFVDEVNAQHSSGFDGFGAPGLDFYTIPGSATNASTGIALDAGLSVDTNLIAAAGLPSAEVGDGDNLRNILDVEDNPLFSGGTQNSREFISSLYSDLGNAIVGFEVEAITHGAIVEDLTSLKDASSRVDLDEEAVSLIQYQAAYQAAARVITAADDLLKELFSMVR
jgi:flagellar hook-associated protein 1 FlgK